MEEEKKKPLRKRLSVDITDDFHLVVKKMALKREITLKKYVMRALERAVASELPLHFDQMMNVRKK